MNAPISVAVTTTGLNALKRVALAYTTRVPSVMANTTTLFVLKSAFAHTRTTPVGTINTELSVLVTVRTGPRGGRRKTNTFTAPSAIQRTNHTVPLAYLIISARANPTSNYNRLTGGRFLLPNHPGRATLAAARRMLSSRRSSTHLLQSTWIPLIADIAPFVPKYATRGSGRGPTTPALRTANAAFGHVTPAQDGAIACFALIENRLGLDGPNPTLNAARNRALWSHLAPALQTALDEETVKTQQFIAREELKRHFQPLAQQGFIIDI